MAGPPHPNAATPSVRFASNVTGASASGAGGTAVPPPVIPPAGTAAKNQHPSAATAAAAATAIAAAGEPPTAHLDGTSQTYASLIQQYLSVLCYENATFYAERMVAHDPTDVAVYLLAMCHYRSGNVRRARCVLLERGVGSNNNGSGGSSGSGAGESSSEAAIASASVYLLAKCSSDLRLYAEAEDVLLRPCRSAYRGLHPNGNAAATAATNGDNANDNDDFLSNHPDADLDRWVLTTSPCPIPNGAAGLALLGHVCRRSDRPTRAARYYRMSLKLDPMLWTSYEALCEMGAAHADVDDPTAVFGVVPPSLRWKDVIAGVDVDGLDGLDGGKNDGGEGMVVEGEDAASSPSFISMGASPGVVGGGAPTPMSLDGGTAAAAAAAAAQGGAGADVDESSASLLPTRSLFRSAGGGGRRGGVGAGAAGAGAGPGGVGSGVGPFDTPDLTPIQRRGGDEDSSRQYATRSRQRNDGGGGGSGGGGGASNAHPPSAGGPRRTPPMTGNSDVVSRARTVASRLYYAPSPETTPPHILGSGLDSGSAIKAPPSIKAAYSARKSARKAGRYGGRGAPPLLGGLGTELDYSSASASSVMTGGDTTGNRGRLSFGSATTTGASVQTPLGERALFASTDGGDAVGEHQDQSFAAEDSVASSDAMEMPPPAPRPPAASATIPSAARKNAATHSDSEEDNECGTGEDGGVQEILEILCLLGAAQRRLCEYRCRDALRVYYKLPHSQFYTGYVQHQVGRAYFELSDYQNAQKALETMQRIEPHRMKGLEVLSTALWHLKKEVELSSLAQRAIDFDRHSAEAWCVVGNCFSLQKEHETALTFFRRSVRLDPSFTYSHTLSGHEYVANEDFDKAATCYRDALRADERHYNAWYGLGAIYFRQEKHDLAEYHFRKALSINPQSSVLRCHLGMAQHANGRAEDALETLASALRIDPRNPQARYQRATIYMTMDRPEEALLELERVRDAAPREASVHFAMGRVLKRLGRPEQAMRCFLTALDLDPKDNNLISKTMARLDEPDLDEDESEF